MQGTKPNTISLLLGHPAPDTLPVADLWEAFNSSAVREASVAGLSYGPEQGEKSLLDYLITRFNRTENFDIRLENIILAPGATSALDTITRLYAPYKSAKPASVIVEAPSYRDALHVLTDHGVTLHAVPIDEDGLCMDSFAQVLDQLLTENNKPAFIYIIPDYHNPAGVSLSLERRHRLIELAKEHNLLIVEDCVYREISFKELPPPSLYALAKTAGIPQNVIHTGSFSKALAPGLRVGWIVAEPEHINRIENCGVFQMGGGANPLTAELIAAYCNSGKWDGHIEFLREAYNRRCQLALQALSEHMPQGVTWTKPTGGFFIWITLPEAVQAESVKQIAAERGVLLSSGKGFFVDPEAGNQNLRITFSFAALADLDKAISVVAEVIKEQMGR